MNPIIVLLSILVMNIGYAYEKPMLYLLDKDYQKTKQSAYIKIQNNSSKEEIKAILSLLDKYSHELYDSNNFVAKVISFNDGKCVNNKIAHNTCEKALGDEFTLTQEGLLQKITISHTKLIYKTSKKTKNTLSKVSFGKALHLIKPPTKTQSPFYYVLAREIEETKKNEILKQTLNLFRIESLKKNKSCKLAEFDITHDEKNYKLMTTFAKVLAPKHKCESGVIKF